MKLIKIRVGSYCYGDWRVLHLKECGSYIVWNITTVTRTARFCPYTEWFPNFANAKRFLLEKAQ